MINHTAITLYTAAFALEALAAILIGSDVFAARRRSSAYSTALAANDVTETARTEVTDKVTQLLDDLTDLPPDRLREHPDLIVAVVKGVVGLLHGSRLMTQSDLLRLKFVTDAEGGHTAARAGVALLLISIVIGFLGNISSAGAFGH